MNAQSSLNSLSSTATPRRALFSFTRGCMGNLRVYVHDDAYWKHCVASIWVDRSGRKRFSTQTTYLVHSAVDDVSTGANTGAELYAIIRAIIAQDEAERE